MKAIKVTQKLKDDNPKHLGNISVGQIVRLEPPNVFVVNGQKVLGFDNDTIAQQWANILTIEPPVYDPNTQKLGVINETGTFETEENVIIETETKVEFNEETNQLENIEVEFERIEYVILSDTRQYTYEIVDLTPEEIFNRQYPNRELTPIQFREMLDYEFGIDSDDMLFEIINGIPDQNLPSEAKKSAIRSFRYAKRYNLPDAQIEALLPLLNAALSLNKTIEDLYQYFQDYGESDIV